MASAYLIWLSAGHREVGGSSTTHGIVGLSAAIPGSQTTLRAAIIEANATGAARSIDVGRGTYHLTLNGSGGDVDGDDLTIWQDHYGNYLTLTNLDAILA